MRMTRLGRTDLTVSRIAFGTWQLGGDWGSVDEPEVIATIRRARELGVNLFDTAQGYGFGASERLLAKALRVDLPSNREGVVLATKGGINPGGARTRSASRDFLRAGVESSLKALGVDYIDLYQVHWPDPATPAEETAGALQELVDAGKIRHVGVSNYGLDELAAFDAIRPVETVQPPYHLFQRSAERDILPFARQRDIGVLAYSPLASGLLTGALTAQTTFEPGDWRAHATAFAGENLRHNLVIVDKLDRFAQQRQITVAQLAIAWTLAQPGVHTAIVGARSTRHLEPSLAAVDVTLKPDDLAEIDSLTAGAIPVVGATPEGVR